MSGEPEGPAAGPSGTGETGGSEAPGEPGDRRSLAERLADRTRIHVPARHNPTLAAVVERVNRDDELYALWVAQNVNAVERLRISDHGPVHVQIVANSALRLLRLLMDAGVEPALVTDYGLAPDDAEVAVVLAALFHDVGISIHRDGHEAYSLFVARPKLERLLEEHYGAAEATILRSEILHAVISHRAGGDPLTLEAGILKVADALDMAEGRMTNSAGVFQLDELLRRKLRGSGLEPYLQVEAHIEGETEKRLVERFRL